MVLWWAILFPAISVPIIACTAVGIASGGKAAPLAVAESRKIVIEATDQPDEVGWKMSGQGIMKMFGTEDFSEGLTAFAEKRDPVWKGR